MPIHLVSGNSTTAIIERSPKILFDRLIAFYVQRGLPVPIDAGKFQQGLRERFIERLAERVEQFEIRLYLFVCMTNHFHLVFETPRANCSRFMQSLSTAYTVYYNLRHGRHGHLLDGRYKAKLADGDEYLLRLSRYVHLNPVQVGSLKDAPLAERIKALRAFEWSSYPSYIGRRKRLDFVEYGPLLAELGGKESVRPRRYRDFVESGLAESDEEFVEVLREDPRCIGGETFRDWVNGLYLDLAGRHARPEDVSLRRTSSPVHADEVLRLVAGDFGVRVGDLQMRRRDSLLRAVAAHCLCRHAGLTQRAAATALNMGSGASVSLQLRKLSKAQQADKKLARRIAALDQRLADGSKRCT